MEVYIPTIDFLKIHTVQLTMMTTPTVIAGQKRVQHLQLYVSNIDYSQVFTEHYIKLSLATIQATTLYNSVPCSIAIQIIGMNDENVYTQTAECSTLGTFSPYDQFTFDNEKDKDNYSD